MYSYLFGHDCSYIEPLHISRDQYEYELHIRINIMGFFLVSLFDAQKYVWKFVFFIVTQRLALSRDIPPTYLEHTDFSPCVSVL